MTRAKEPRRKPNSIRLLELLAERPHNRVELLAGSGLEHEQVKDTLWNLRKRGMAVTNKTVGELANYEITQKGMYWLFPETDPYRRASAERAYRKKLARNAKYRREKGQAERVAKPPKPPKQKMVAAPKPVIDRYPIEHRVVPAPCVPDSIVSAAIQSRPAFQAAWC